ncbi:hypothetical protein GH714_000471 [Hevea brasiliensis]|uniref:non-specific serine/threonine protein kinase n=1 Tax=Hevea brasiliensis TaxID=3981 RepID=A0A6A6N861_HEVBR|nr:hypothetical protein GH714_000471 [Hevea brasiliensis]
MESRMDQFEIMEQIGRGAFGAAILVHHKYVLKKIRLARQTERCGRSAHQEMVFIARIQQPYIVEFKEAWVEKVLLGKIVVLRSFIKLEFFVEFLCKLCMWFTQLLLAVEYLHANFVLHRDLKASEILKHRYLQPYVDQYRPSFTPPTTCSPEKPISTHHDSRKTMAESQNSNGSSSNKESLLSSDRNVPVIVPNCEHKATDTDLASIDDEDGDEQHMPSEEGNSPTESTVKMDENRMVKPYHDEHGSNIESKQPKTIKSIMMALKEGKTRENGSLVRGNCIKVRSSQRSNTEASPKVLKPTQCAGSWFEV